MIILVAIYFLPTHSLDSEDPCFDLEYDDCLEDCSCGVCYTENETFCLSIEYQEDGENMRLITTMRDVSQKVIGIMIYSCTVRKYIQ